MTLFNTASGRWIGGGSLRAAMIRIDKEQPAGLFTCVLSKLSKIDSTYVFRHHSHRTPHGQGQVHSRGDPLGHNPTQYCHDHRGSFHVYGCK
jgi:hypothetical protein